jgi:hypothetical protein
MDDDLPEGPERIYLQVSGNSGEITWCDERIEDVDVEYVRVDVIKSRIDHWRVNAKFIVDEETILADLETLLTCDFG